MGPHTKGRVSFAWKTQRVLRVFALLAALGAVFCVIVIRKTSTTAGWIIRVGPGVALAHTLYATYFHMRGITSRPPASSASYQMFAGLIDAGLLPFFAIACYMATLDYTSNQYGWDTIFNENNLDYSIIKAFMIVCGVEGFLLLLSLILDVYLAVIYRKITRLPPDMNPLEERDNLTARPRHKRNKSELEHEKHLSNSTMASERFSEMTQQSIHGRRVPFKHTRTDSADRDSFSFKKDVLDELRDPYSARASLQLMRDHGPPSRPTSAHTPATNARTAGAGLEHKPTRSSALASPPRPAPPRPSSWLSSANFEGVPAEVYDYENRQETMSPVSITSERPPPYLSTNASNNIPSSARAPNSRAHNQENNMPSPEQLSLALPPTFATTQKRSREPLKMNPPTPVSNEFDDENLRPRPLSVSSYSTPPRHALRETDVNSVAQYATPSSRPASFVGSGTKSRFYGDLRNSIGGSPTRQGYEDDNEEEIVRSNTVKSAESGNFEVYASESDDEYDPYCTVQPSPFEHGPAVVVGPPTPNVQWNGYRQASNSTGYDLHAGYAGLDPEFGKGMAARRREVSGKIVEEGRGFEIATEPVQVRTSKPGAAGWARFKGL